MYMHFRLSVLDLGARYIGSCGARRSRDYARPNRWRGGRMAAVVNGAL